MQGVWWLGCSRSGVAVLALLTALLVGGSVRAQEPLLRQPSALEDAPVVDLPAPSPLESEPLPELEPEPTPPHRSKQRPPQPKTDRPGKSTSTTSVQPEEDRKLRLHAARVSALVAVVLSAPSVLLVSTSFAAAAIALLLGGMEMAVLYHANAQGDQVDQATNNLFNALFYPMAFFLVAAPVLALTSAVTGLVGPLLAPWVSWPVLKLLKVRDIHWAPVLAVSPTPVLFYRLFQGLLPPSLVALAASLAGMVAAVWSLGILSVVITGECSPFWVSTIAGTTYCLPCAFLPCAALVSSVVTALSLLAGGGANGAVMSGVPRHRPNFHGIFHSFLRMLPQDQSEDALDGEDAPADGEF